jgi:hypothetical protein
LKKLASTETRLIRRCTAIGSFCTSWPKTLIAPPSGTNNVASRRINVDLPLPLGPNMPKISPRRTSNETRLTAMVGLRRPLGRGQNDRVGEPPKVL